MSQNNTKRNYQATFILDTRTYQEPVENLIEKIKETISGIKATVLDLKNQGQKSFARVTDRRFPSGIYVCFNISADADFPVKLKERFKLDKFVNRVFITHA